MRDIGSMALTKEQMIERIIDYSGVSRSTVFRYLAGKQVRKNSEEALLAAASDLHFDLFLQKKVTSQDILVSISPRFNIFRGYAEVLSGVMHKAEETGNDIKLNHNIQDDNKGCGVIIIGKSEQEEEEEIELLLAQRIPFVLINRHHDNPGVSWVSVDNRMASREGCEHLRSRGYGRIGFWGGGEGVVSQDKLAGYLDSHTRNGQKVDPDLLYKENEINIEEAFRRARQSSGGVDSWLAIDDDIAIKVMKLAIDAGYRIPEQFGICGMNDIDAAEHFIPSLTSVNIPFKEMGEIAVGILLELLENPLYTSVKKIVNHRLIIRDSSSGKI